ncbi:hypothetical protein [Streptomyces sp. NPDC048659]|uniref:hypothetical protein n=1 Tax=Streptomyces sp. NPDC048659 TaxID=3155489 RepID=UPI0034459647
MFAEAFGTAVDWAAIPGPPGWYDPARARHGLRALANAANLVDAARAGSRLGGGGIVHGHSAAVFPAAVAAAPLLLSVAEDGHPAAREVALGLLDEALSFFPHAGFARVSTSYDTAVPICCALANELRARADLLAALGKRGKDLLADASVHWRFDIQEPVADGADAAAFGTLAGRFPASGAAPAAELPVGGEIVILDEVTLEYAPMAGARDACLRVRGQRPSALPPGAVLFAAECGERLH